MYDSVPTNDQRLQNMSERKLAVHLMYSRGRFFLLSSQRLRQSRRLWLTKSKYPLMSKVNAEVTLPTRQAVCTSVRNVKIASSVEQFERPPNWLGGMRFSCPARKVSRFAASGRG